MNSLLFSRSLKLTIYFEWTIKYKTPIITITFKGKLYWTRLPYLLLTFKIKVIKNIQQIADWIYFDRYIQVL